jgi:transposase
VRRSSRSRSGFPDDPTREIGVCLERGYDYSEVHELVGQFGFTAHIRSRKQEADAIRHEAGFRARRWVVERTHSWLNGFRRLLVRWERRARTYIAMLHLACGLITWREALKSPLPK